MKIRAALLLLSILSTAARADLPGDADAILADDQLAKASVGVQVIRLGESASSSRVIYRHDALTPLMPASNLKVVTTSAALDKFGGEFRFKTQLVVHDHDLIVVGDGDPAFGDAELLTRVGWDVNTVFLHWAKVVKDRNVGVVRNVVVDDSIFDEQFFHPHWSADQRSNRYEAEVGGMNLNANSLDLFLRPGRRGAGVSVATNPPTHYASVVNGCVTEPGHPLLNRAGDDNVLTLKGSTATANTVPLAITLHDPGLFAATVLAESLATSGIDHSGDVTRDRSVRTRVLDGDKGYTVLAVHETPIEQVLARANKDSMNLYGECLCKRLGAEAAGRPGSWENGTAAVGAFLGKLGVPAKEFDLDDGCGLSKQNRITANAMTRVLEYDYFGSNRKMFMDSLAVAGVDGTLSERFKEGNLKGRVLAKTGTITGASTLSGYLHGRDGRWYAFSVLVNGTTAAVSRQVQERIVRAVDASVPEAR